MTQTHTANVRYFALLRELSGRQSEQWSIESGTTLENLYHMVANRYGLPLALEDVRVAVNDEFTRMEYVICAGDSIAFIPPVSGG